MFFAKLKVNGLSFYFHLIHSIADPGLGFPFDATGGHLVATSFPFDGYLPSMFYVRTATLHICGAPMLCALSLMRHTSIAYANLDCLSASICVSPPSHLSLSDPYQGYEGGYVVSFLRNP